MCALVLASCTTEIDPPPAPPVPPESGETTTVTFNFDVDNPVAATRAVDENAVSKIQLLLIGAGGQRYYFVPGNEKFVAASIERGKYEVYAVANYADIIKDYPASRLLSLATAHREGDGNIVMSFRAVADFTAGASRAYAVRLVRSVAKLRFNVTAAPNVTITGMTLRTIPTVSPLFTGGYTGKNYSNSITIDPASRAFTLYMPENLAGTNTAITDPTGRTAGNAPSNATYLLIEGKVVSPKGRDTVEERDFESRVYLGGNTTTDFNVRRNYDYRIDINIAADLSTDTRITHSEVGYTAVERRTADGKFIWCGFGATPFVTITPYYNGSGSVDFKCVVTGYSREMQVKATSLKTVGDGLSPQIVTSGTLTAGQKETVTLSYDAWNLAPVNCRIKAVMTFTTPDGTVREYEREWRFANRSHVYIEPQYGTDYNEKTAEITTPDGCIEMSSDRHAMIYHAEKNLQLTVHPLPGYTFKGWYSKERPYKTQNRITLEPTVTVTVGRRDGIMFYARVEKI